MTATMTIDFEYEATGQVMCRNPKGMTFFLYSEPFGSKPAPAAAPAEPAPAWKQVDATVEATVRRATEPQAITEQVRAIPKADFTPVQATQEVEVRREVPAAPPVRGTGPLLDAPQPGKEASKGWFNRLFAKG